MSDLNQVFAALGRLEAQGEESQRQRRRLFAKVEEVQESVAENGVAFAGMEARVVDLEDAHVKEVKPVLEDYKKTKAKGYGVLVGLGMVTGSLGAHMDKAWAGIKEALGF